MIDLGDGVWLITRAEWGARPPRSTTSLSVSTNTDHWEGPHMGWPWSHASCPAKVRAIQNFHMDSRGWTDIAYNSLSCGHGYVFEGRGRGRRSAANGTNAGNSGSYADCYLGGQGDAFTELGKLAKKKAGDWLTHAGSRRVCHRDWKSTECPGSIICSWTHDGQPVGPVVPQQPLPVATLEPNMKTFTSDTNAKPWVAWTESGRFVGFSEDTPAARAWVAESLGIGGEWAPNAEWHAGVQTGIIEHVKWGDTPIPQKVSKGDHQFNEALQLLRRVRVG